MSVNYDTGMLNITCIGALKYMQCVQFPDLPEPVLLSEGVMVTETALEEFDVRLRSVV